MEDDFEIPGIVEIPIDGILDLHTFQPSEVRDLVMEYLEACREKGILEVRIIHGKGQGVLRRIVESTLAGIDFVNAFGLDLSSGNWGVTIVSLDPEDC